MGFNPDEIPEDMSRDQIQAWLNSAAIQKQQDDAAKEQAAESKRKLEAAQTKHAEQQAAYSQAQANQLNATLAGIGLDARGLTPLQAATLDERSKYHQGLIDVRGKKGAKGEGGQTPNSMAVDRRAVDKELNKLEDEETKFNETRMQLGSAIAAGTHYYPKAGQPKLMQEGDDKKGLIRDMQSRFDAATESLKKNIRRRNQLLASSGRTIGVSTEDAIKALEPKAATGATLGTVGTPAGQVPIPTPVPAPPVVTPPAPATLAAPKTEADLRQRAKASGKSDAWINEAVKAARSKGLIQ